MFGKKPKQIVMEDLIGFCERELEELNKSKSTKPVTKNHGTLKKSREVKRIEIKHSGEDIQWL